MLKVFLIGGIYVPALCCDFCRRHIDQPEWAGYFYDVDAEFLPVGKVYLFHKDCADKFEIERQRRFDHWDEMTYLLERLPINAQPLDRAINDYDLR